MVKALRLILLFLSVAALVFAPFLLALYSLPKEPAKLVFKKQSYAALPDWGAALFEPASGFLSDNVSRVAFWQAFERSCAALLKMPADKKMPGPDWAGKASQWQKPCTDFDRERKIQQAAKMAGTTSAAFCGAKDTGPEDMVSEDLVPKDTGPEDMGNFWRSWFEAHFTPYSVEIAGHSEGLFTGYYEPLLEGSFEKSAAYPWPIYALPEDLVRVDLGVFKPDLKGKKLVGKLKDGALLPYDDRRAIEQNEAKTLKPLLYVDDPIGAFFLHIQGSGRVRMPDGRLVSVGYAGQNGHDYVSIGRLLRDQGAIRAEDLSLQTIRAWLKAHPEEASAVMQANPSFVFFRLLAGGEGPFGASGVSLTPAHSMAIDPRYLPFHMPIYLSAAKPDLRDPQKTLPLQTILMTQDTGGAIKGQIRGDVFWGFGPEAEILAGAMKAPGRYWIFLPEGLEPRLEKSEKTSRKDRYHGAP